MSVQDAHPDAENRFSGIENPEMLTKDALSLYETYLRGSQSHIPHTTANTYFSAVKTFAEWPTTPETVEAITERTVRRYQLELREVKAANTAVLYSYGLRHFFKWLVEEAYIIDNPCERVLAPKTEKVIRPEIPEAVFEQIWEATVHIPRQLNPTRARAIAAILQFCGLRRSELLDLELPDVDFKNRTLHVRHGKGDKARTVEFAPVVGESIRDYLQDRPVSLLKSLFLWSASKRLAKEGLYSTIATLCDIARVEYRLTPHDFRHHYITNLIRKGTDLATVRDLAGHGDIKTTGLYAHSEEKTRRKASEAVVYQQPVRVQEAQQEPRQRRYNVKRIQR